uniref:Alpha-catulin n=1 Tax=Plectus sambesii TaxID=2011161 RepID=A0A914WCK1_9BILA
MTLDVEDQQKMAKVGLEMKLLTSEVDAEAEKWDEYAENDIVKRAKSMSSMAYNMYLFTRGDGPLKTTHDLFTQAEFFAEEANKMYKTVREFSYEVPGSAEKNDLSTILEKIPIHCQQLQVLVKSPTVGKSATFSKVDSVIQETKNLMNEIAKLVTACFVCATKPIADGQERRVVSYEVRGKINESPGDSGKSTKWVVEPHIDLSFWEGNEGAAPLPPSQTIVQSSSTARYLPGHPPFVRCSSPPRSFTNIGSKSSAANDEPKKRYIGLFGNMAKRHQAAKQAATAAPRRAAR